MSKEKIKKTARPRAILPRGFRDRSGGEVRRRDKTLAAIRAVFDLYGFEPLETPAIEYVEALGKFLPDVERPMGGVFGFQDDDEKWLALRYDLTAPLARMVAASYDALPKPFRRYQTGPVYRNERPGPGRFREFTQFDADSVGSAEMAADAELCMMTAEALEAVGIARGDYLVRVNNRKVLNGVLEHIGIGEDGADGGQRLAVLRAIDKLDRLGGDGVRALLGAGRKDRSGDFTRGAELTGAQIEAVLAFIGAGSDDPGETCDRLAGLVGDSQTGAEGVAELRDIAALTSAAGFGPDRLKIDPSVVRGLGYYTGPVFEAELTFPVVNDKGETVVFGAVAGGGRYDNLVKRFIGRDVPATGVSIGVDRLLSALAARRPDEADAADGPVVVVVMDRDVLPRYQAMAAELRTAGIRAEMYVGGAGMRAQLKYADKRRSPVAVIEGEDERAQGMVTLKDLRLGAKLAAHIEDRDDWAKGQPAQVTIPRDSLVKEVGAILARHRPGPAGQGRG